MIKTINKKIVEFGQGDVCSHFEIRNNGSKKIGIIGLDNTIKGEIGTSPNEDRKDIFDREIVFMFNNSKSIDILIKDLQWLKEQMIK